MCQKNNSSLKKILIIENLDSIQAGLNSVLNDHFDFEIDQTYSFDNAFIKILKSFKDNKPYDLLITNLSFSNEEFTTQKIKTVQELIYEFRKFQTDLKIIIYSMNDNPYLLNKMKNEYHVNGIVINGNNSLPKLCSAIESVGINKKFFSLKVLSILKKDPLLKINKYDVQLLDLLSKGLTQHAISTHFKQEKIKPNSVSTIEKRIGELKITFKAKNSIHLISMAKDEYLI